jgi:hypothetical protein
MVFSWDSLPTFAKGVDIFIALCALTYTAGAFGAWSHRSKEQRNDPAERNLAISAIGSFLTLNTTANSILLAGVGVLSRLPTTSGTVSKELFTQLLLAGFCFLASLVFGAMAAAYVINHVHHKTSVAENAYVMGFSVAQFGSTVGGASYLTIALFLL